jgi:hypothetical protein
VVAENDTPYGFLVQTGRYGRLKNGRLDGPGLHARGDNDNALWMMANPDWATLSIWRNGGRGASIVCPPADLTEIPLCSAGTCHEVELGHAPTGSTAQALATAEKTLGWWRSQVLLPVIAHYSRRPHHHQPAQTEEVAARTNDRMRARETCMMWRRWLVVPSDQGYVERTAHLRVRIVMIGTPGLTEICLPFAMPMPMPMPIPMMWSRW